RAKEFVAQIPVENRRLFNKKRIAAKQYQEDDLVTIRYTLNFYSKYFWPYEITEVLRNDVPREIRKQHSRSVEGNNLHRLRNVT
ncbi:hypothetical protein WH47_05575, partial [Habropoda laboriosa]